MFPLEREGVRENFDNSILDFFFFRLNIFSIYLFIILSWYKYFSRNGIEPTPGISEAWPGMADDLATAPNVIRGFIIYIIFQNYSYTREYFYWLWHVWVLCSMVFEFQFFNSRTDDKATREVLYQINVVSIKSRLAF